MDVSTPIQRPLVSRLPDFIDVAGFASFYVLAPETHHLQGFPAKEACAISMQVRCSVFLTIVSDRPDGHTLPTHRVAPLREEHRSAVWPYVPTIGFLEASGFDYFLYHCGPLRKPTVGVLALTTFNVGVICDLFPLSLRALERCALFIGGNEIRLSSQQTGKPARQTAIAR
jgi:hypothetical protein